MLKYTILKYVVIMNTVWDRAVMCVVLILFSNQAPPSLSLSLSLSFSLGLLTFKQGAKALLLGHETSEREREREVRDHKDLLMKSNMHLICALQVCRSHDAQRWDEAPGDSQRQLPIRADDVQTGTRPARSSLTLTGFLNTTLVCYWSVI